MKTTRRAWLLKTELIGKVDSTEKALIFPIVFEDLRPVVNGTKVTHEVFGRGQLFGTKHFARKAMHAALSDNGRGARKRHERRRKNTGATT